MTKLVRMLDKFWFLSLNGKLNLADIPAKHPHIHQNIIGRLFQPVLHPDNLQLLRLLSACFYDVFVKVDDFRLFGWAFAAHEVANFEGEQIGRGRPQLGLEDVSVGAEPLLRDLQQPMNQPIQICNDIVMQIIDNFNSKNPTGLFQRLNIGTRIRIL